jgi:sugar lactone lactonase YvrE
VAKVIKPEVASDVGAEHGEGPLWHLGDRRLDWTDLEAGRLHRFDPLTGRDEVIEVGSPLGAFAARQQGGFVLAVKDGFAFLDMATGRCDLVAPVEYGTGIEMRMNDGKCDPQGRFWAGSMALDATRGAGSLYRLDTDLSVTKVLDDVTASNGLDWSDNGQTLYYIDSLAGQAVWDRPTSGVDAFDFDPSTGAISGRRRIIDIENDPTGTVGMTLGDGLTVDAAGFIWVAVSGAGEVRRYSPDAELDTVVEMPVACPTSVAFGGDDVADLYITTTTLEAVVPPEYRRHAAFAEQRPHEGALFVCRPGVPGRPPRSFAG